MWLVDIVSKFSNMASNVSVFAVFARVKRPFRTVGTVEISLLSCFVRSKIYDVVTICVSVDYLA